MYSHLNAIGVNGERRSRRSFFISAEVFQLGAVKFYLSQGCRLNKMAGLVSDSVEPLSSRPSVASASFCSSSLALLGDFIADALARQDASPLDVYWQLAEAANRSFLLSTSVLASVLGISSPILHGWNFVEERLKFALFAKNRGVGVFQPPFEIIL